MLFPYIKAPKNGYCYVYLSNESDEPVYFDNFRVIHNRGRIIEENHYYAYGLKIAAISSRKAGDAREGKLDNQHLYNDKELIEDADLGWYDYGFRNYDPQVGRFPQLDPLTFAYPYYTPYQYAGCDPITNVDVDGLEPFNTIFGQLHQVVDEYAKELMTPVKVVAVSPFSAGLASVGIASALEKEAVEKLAQEVYAQAFRWSMMAQLAARGGLTTVATLIPLRAGPNLPDEANGDDMWGRKQLAHYEELRNNASEASDAYLADVKKRLDNGTATFNDNAYRDEIARRAAREHYNTIPGGKQANHIFSGKPNKFFDNSTNRKLITDLTNDGKNYLGIDKYGKSWYAKTLSDGTQIYGYTQDGIVKGAGINPQPLDIFKRQELKK